MFKVLWIILLIYLLFRLLTRTLFPFLARNYVKKAQEKFYQQNPDIDPEEAKKREGEVKIKSRPQTSSHKKDELGDYVDFEEVDE